VFLVVAWAATDAIVKLLNSGDEVLSTNDLYGGTYRAFTKIFSRFGLKFQFIPMQDADVVERSITPATKMIWIETPTNPMLNIVDIEAICRGGAT
jgi:cystathionine gamma-lyase